MQGRAEMRNPKTLILRVNEIMCSKSLNITLSAVAGGVIFLIRMKGTEMPKPFIVKPKSPTPKTHAPQIKELDYAKETEKSPLPDYPFGIMGSTDGTEIAVSFSNAKKVILFDRYLQRCYEITLPTEV